MRKTKQIPFSLTLVITISILLVACGDDTPEPTSTALPGKTPAVQTPETELTVPAEESNQEADDNEAGTPVIGETAAADTPVAMGLTAVIVSGDRAGAGKPFTFDATQSQAGDAEIASYVWIMGDGTTLFGLSVEHAYGEPGFYTVNLIITDENGQTDTAAKVVEITDQDTEVTPTVEGAFELAGSNWQLSNAMRGTTVTLLFQEDELSGSTGCNDYAARYSTIGQDELAVGLTVSSISVGDNLCIAEIMAQEKGYLESLNSAVNYVIDGGMLIIETGSGTLTFVLDTN